MSALSLSLQEPDLARRAALLAMAATLSGVAACSRAEPAPAFAYTVLDGTRRHSDALRGRVMLMNFWATTCASCVREMPQFVATHRRFHAAGLQTLAVAMQHDAPARVSSFAQQRQLPFDVVIDNTGHIAEAFGRVRVTPTTLLVDRGGLIVWRHEGEPDFEALHARVERLLQGPA